MPKNNSKAQRELRKKGAEERQNKHNALTVEQKIVKASERSGDSSKEITRLGIEAGVYNATGTLKGKKIGIRQ